LFHPKDVWLVSDLPGMPPYLLYFAIIGQNWFYSFDIVEFSCIDVRMDIHRLPQARTHA
jgi:hypothetical protein